MTESIQIPNLDPIESIPKPIHEFFLAAIYDGIVYQTLNIDPQTAALYVAGPTFIQVEQGQVQQGWSYDATDGTFAPPVPE
jgi:hypothetical protein